MSHHQNNSGSNESKDHGDSSGSGFVRVGKGGLQCYSGLSHERGRATEFIQNFESVMALNDVLLTSSEALRYFQLCLRGGAKHWWTVSVQQAHEVQLNQWKAALGDITSRVAIARASASSSAPAQSPASQAEEKSLLDRISSSPLESYPAVKVLFMARYVSKNDHAIMHEVQACRLSSFSCVDEYHDEMEDLFSRAENRSMDSDALKIQMWISGCDVPNFKKELVKASPSSTVMAYDVAKRYETAMKMEGKWRPYNRSEEDVEEESSQGYMMSPAGRSGPRQSNNNRGGNYNNNRGQSNYGGRGNMNAIAEGASQSNGNPRPTLLDALNTSLDSKFKAHTDSLCTTITKAMGDMSLNIVKAIQQDRRKAGASQRSNECWNCRETGHTSRDCPHPPNRRAAPSSSGTGNPTSSNRQGNIRSSGPSGSSPSQSQAPRASGNPSASSSSNNKPWRTSTNLTYDDEDDEDEVNVMDQDHNPYYDEDADDDGQSSYCISADFGSDSSFPVVGVNTTQSLSTSSSSLTHDEVDQKYPPSVVHQPLDKIRATPLFANAVILFDNKPVLSVKVIVDTGSGISVVALDALKHIKGLLSHSMKALPHDYNPKLAGAAVGSELQKVGIIDLHLRVSTITLRPMTFIVVRNLSNEVILGNDELSKEHMFGGLNVARKTLEYLGNGSPQVIPLENNKAPRIGTTGSTVKPKGPKDNSNTSMGNSKAPTVRQLKDAKNPLKFMDVGAVMTIGEHTIGPHAELLLDSSSSMRIPSMKQFHSNVGEKAASAVFVTTVHPNFRRLPVGVANTVTDSSDAILRGRKGVHLHLVNRTDRPVKIAHNTLIAHVEAMWPKVEDVVDINTIMKQVHEYHDRMAKGEVKQH